jgi:hypothetical protein
MKGGIKKGNRNLSERTGSEGGYFSGTRSEMGSNSNGSDDGSESCSNSGTRIGVGVGTGCPLTFTL